MEIKLTVNLSKNMLVQDIYGCLSNTELHVEEAFLRGLNFFRKPTYDL